MLNASDKRTVDVGLTRAVRAVVPEPAADKPEHRDDQRSVTAELPYD
jgi:hypothetical protein